MPELPEIEHLRRSLEPALVQGTVRHVCIHRADVVGFRPAPAPSHRAQLLLDQTIVEVRRLGKQLAFISDAGPVICLHMGMTGHLRFLPRRARPARTDHIHISWSIDGPAGKGRLIFRDPRRFGGVWTFASADDLHTHRWDSLGPDALTITTAQLRQQLARTSRPVKAALLDQHVIAGVGNIYADECLFKAGIHPASTTSALDGSPIRRLASAIRSILGQALRSGGSTFRDYYDANGEPGEFVMNHQVYGRAGHPCRCCGEVLRHTTLAQRSTVYCTRCQPVMS